MSKHKLACGVCGVDYFDEMCPVHGEAVWPTTPPAPAFATGYNFTPEADAVRGLYHTDGDYVLKSAHDRVVRELAAAHEAGVQVSMELAKERARSAKLIEALKRIHGETYLEAERIARDAIQEGEGGK